jgi:hypothetical protein
LARKIDAVPYVPDGDIYLFIGESFGINFLVVGNHVTQVTYHPDLAKADVQFELTQEKFNDKWGSMLVIQNKTNHVLRFDAMMTVPTDKNPHNTSILPVSAKLSNYESWPDPIVQLVLRNLRVTENKSE